MFPGIVDVKVFSGMFYELLVLAGQKHRGATFDGDSVLRSTHCTQTQRLVQRLVLHTHHLHTFNSLGAYNHLKVSVWAFLAC